MDDARVELASAGVIKAIQNHDDNVIFDWLLQIMQFQGVSDAAARAFVDEHGLLTAREIAEGLFRNPSCPKLRSYYHFEGCGYQKWKRHCNEARHLDACPLPRHDFRNGTLNQMAYSLFLFFRDVTRGDFVRWVDLQIRGPGLLTGMDDPLSTPLAHVFGIGPKVARLAMSVFLLGGDVNRKHWQTTGGALIVVDSLVHNWMHRTGILKLMDAEHSYGEGCYGQTGCAALIQRLARLVDARRFNPDYPRYFPRFVQYAIWTFCSADGLNICNGNKIDDFKRCKRRDCDLHDLCSRQRLHRLRPEPRSSEPG